MWNHSLINEVKIPIFGNIEIENGEEFRPIIGFADGYHLNVSPEIANEFEGNLIQYSIAPQTPYIIFANSPTVFLKFTNKDEALSIMSKFYIS